MERTQIAQRSQHAADASKAVEAIAPRHTTNASAGLNQRTRGVRNTCRRPVVAVVVVAAAAAAMCMLMVMVMVGVAVAAGAVAVVVAINGCCTSEYEKYFLLLLIKG